MKYVAGSGVLALAALLSASTSLAQEQESRFRYEVQPGDTCRSIAARFFGDSARVDLIHIANPGMGPTPHSLAPGASLWLPRVATGAPSGPDARVAFFRNRVDVHVPAPRRAHLDDPLFRGHKVSTEGASSARLMFRDETQLRLGERTLVVIFGTTSTAAPATGLDTTLVTGNLRARLGELAGGPAKAARVTTAGAQVDLGAGEAQVAVDEGAATRLAVYSGERSGITAKKKKVPVPAGFGSKAVKGETPTAPAPLPGAPQWEAQAKSLAFAPAGGVASLAIGYTPSTVGPASSRFHLQLARDARFDDLVLDAQVDGSVRRLEAQNLPPGVYFAQVSAIDADQFEGPFAPAMRLVVGTSLRRPERGELTLSVPEGELYCGVDGAAFSKVAEPFRFTDVAAHVVRCSTDAMRGGGTLDVPVPSPLAPPLRLRARWLDAARLAFRLEDGRGPLLRPVAGEVVVFGTAHKLLALPFDGGEYVVAAQGAEARQDAVVVARVHGHDAVSTTARPLDGAPLFAVNGTPSARVEFDVAAGITAGAVGVGRRLDVSASVSKPSSFGAFVLALRATGHEMAPTTVDASSLELATPHTGSVVTKHTAFGLGLPLGLRLCRVGRAICPQLTLAPELLFQSGALGNASSTATFLAGTFAVGAKAHLAGPISLVVEANARLAASVSRSGGAIPLTGGGATMGFSWALGAASRPLDGSARTATTVTDSMSVRWGPPSRSVSSSFE